MAIKPILFNTKMVRAILDGRKTCTRRLVKIQPKDNEYTLVFTRKDVQIKTEKTTVKSPYKVGDILYVRETWCRYGKLDNLDQVIEGTEKYYYRADGENPTPYNHFLVQKKGYDEYLEFPVWSPSIRMPKEAARIWLKVTNVRVERLQEITADDCHREGINIETNAVTDGETLNRNHDFSLEKFETLWDSTIKKADLDCYGWNANPWVWVIEFERCEKPEK